VELEALLQTEAVVAAEELTLLVVMVVVMEPQVETAVTVKYRQSQELQLHMLEEVVEDALILVAQLLAQVVLEEEVVVIQQIQTVLLALTI
jgi:hypothetical protein